MAFAIGGLVFVATLIICVLMIGAEMNSPITGSGSNIIWTFVTGTVISLLIVASHWFPHIGW